MPRPGIRGSDGNLGSAGVTEGECTQLPGLLTGRQCLEIYAASKKLSTIDSDVMMLAESLSFTSMLDRFVDTYSTGARQKLAVLLALVEDPKLIALDETFNGLDPASALALRLYLRERVSSGRSSVLLATHALDLVERYATRAALLLAGKYHPPMDRRRDCNRPQFRRGVRGGSRGRSSTEGR
ncbi:MAG: ATP-binding cassette domain-containing protein [Steroidobacteraceae bacterium]